MSTVLIVDDERGIRAGLSTAVGRIGLRAVAAAGVIEARSLLAGPGEFACVLVDIRLKDGSGLELLRELRAGRHRDTPVIVATAYDDSERTIEAMRDGAFDYLTKPFDLPVLLATVERAVKQRPPPGAAVEAAAEGGPLVGRSAAMHAVWKLIGRAAGSSAPVLVKGEAGTGKELVARAVHAYSPRSPSPPVSLRCGPGTEPGELRAALAAADASTLLLDGVGDLGAGAQAELAAALVAGPSARVIAQVRVAPGDDPVLPELYYQLAVLEISVPPLRERRSDIPLLVARALSGTRARAVSEDAMSLLVAHDWPGNVRELVLAVRRAAEMCGGEVIDAADLPPELANQVGARETANPYHGLPLREALARLERDLLLGALAKSDGNRTLAARLLGIARPQLYAKLEEHGLAGRKPPAAGLPWAGHREHDA